MESVGPHFESGISAAMTFEHNINNIPICFLLLLLLCPVLDFIEQDVCSHLSKPILPVEIDVARVGIDIAISIRASLSEFAGVNWEFARFRDI